MNIADVLYTILLQHKPVRADQEEQLPGLQLEPHQTVRQLSAALPEATGEREHYPLRPQTSKLLLYHASMGSLKPYLTTTNGPQTLPVNRCHLFTGRVTLRD